MVIIEYLKILLNKSKRKLVVQVGRIILVLSVLQIVLQGSLINNLFKDFYLSGVRNEIMDLIYYARASMEEYKALPWLLAYWKEHDDDIDCRIPATKEEDCKWRNKHKVFLARNPRMITSEEAKKLSKSDQKLFAEVAYIDIAEDFDRMMNIYWPSSIFCSTLEEDEYSQYVYFSGIVKKQSYNDYISLRNHPKNITYEEYSKPRLGTHLKYNSKDHKVLRETYESTKDVTKVDQINEDDKEELYMYLPIRHNGKVIATVGGTMTLVGLSRQFIARVREVLIENVFSHSVFGIILLWLIYRVVLKPLRIIQKRLRKYKKDKDSELVRSELQDIHTNNEIEVLAEDIIDVTYEMTEYTKNMVKITAEQERIGTELDMAKKVQMGVLPNVFPAFPDRDEFDIYASLIPARHIGGDFYNFFLVDDDHLAITVGDVSDKGMPAALMMTVANALFKNGSLHNELSPENIMSLVNKQIFVSNKEMLFITVWFGYLEISTGKLTFASAGHEYPIILRKNGTFELLEVDNDIPIGIVDDYQYHGYTEHLEKDDTLLIYTDGITEALNSENIQFSEKRLEKVFSEMSGKSPKEINDHIRECVDEFVDDASRFDDSTMICIKMMK